MQRSPRALPLVIAIGFVAVVVATTTTASATGELDQQQTDTSGSASNVGTNGGDHFTAAQTFTAGRTGRLDAVDVYLRRGAGAIVAVTLELRSTVDGRPGSDLLATAQVDGHSVPPDPNGTFISAAFGAPAAVVAGRVYALVLRTEAGALFRAPRSAADAYDRGSAWAAVSRAPASWVAQPGDFGFRTYVDAPPTPMATPAPTPRPRLETKCDFSGSEKKFKIIKGTNGNDVLTGTPGADLILGYGGNDKIRGGGGNDILCGGAGNDDLGGGGGKDKISGGPGADKLAGNNGDDVLRGGGGRDTVDGGAGRDDQRS